MWEPFAENISDNFSNLHNTEVEDSGPTGCLSEPGCTIFPLITTDKCVKERGEEKECTEEINLFYL